MAKENNYERYSDTEPNEKKGINWPLTLGLLLGGVAGYGGVAYWQEWWPFNSTEPNPAGKIPGPPSANVLQPPPSAPSPPPPSPGPRIPNPSVSSSGGSESEFPLGKGSGSKSRPSERVKLVQKALNHILGAQLKIDGIWGEGTERVALQYVKMAKEKYNIVADTKVTQKEYQDLLSFMNKKGLGSAVSGVKVIALGKGIAWMEAYPTQSFDFRSGENLGYLIQSIGGFSIFLREGRRFVTPTQNVTIR